MKLDRKLKMGMTGGGPGAFIGEVHRKAARMDGGIELTGGAFDINPRKSKQMGRELCLNPKRVYRNYKEMMERELKLPEYVGHDRFLTPFGCSGCGSVRRQQGKQ